MGVDRLEYPRLRPVALKRYDHDGASYVVIEDPLGIAPAPVVVPMEGYQWTIRRFDGLTSIDSLIADIRKQTGQTVPRENLVRIVDELDQSYLLDSPRFWKYVEDYRALPLRTAAHAGGAYAATGPELKRQLDALFRHPAASGAVSRAILPNGDGGPVRGILSPHIDFHRGGPVYTWSYKELIERSDADVFVIVGVAHQFSKNRFALTRKDFETPLGTVRTDQDFVDRLLELAGEKYLEDELAHRTEHSVEFQTVFLQYLLGDKRPFTIVPILAGSFHDLMMNRSDPSEDADVRTFIEALRRTERELGKKVAYIGGIDLGHIGKEFGDPETLNRNVLEELRQFDSSMLERAAAGDASGWFRTASLVDNRYRVCGLAATYVVLTAMGETTGKVLRYDQAVNPELTCCVSFAGVAFEAK